MPKLRVGYLIDGSEQSFLLWDLLQKSRKSTLYSIEALIVQPPALAEPAGSPSQLILPLKKYGVAGMFARKLLTAIERFEKLVVARNPHLSAFFAPTPLDSSAIETLHATPITSTCGSTFEYSEEDLARIRHLQLDLLINGCAATPGKKLSSHSRLGALTPLLSYRDVDPSAPCGFWEVFHREESTSFTIQHHLDDDLGDILFKGRIATSPLYLLNAVRLHLKANAFIHLLIEKIARQGALPSAEYKAPCYHPPYGPPSISACFAYLFKTAFYISKKLVGRWQGKSTRWVVAYQFVEEWGKAILCKSTPVRNPPGRFFADPFVKVKDGRSILFVEDYSDASSRAIITALELHKDGYRELGKALEEPFHLSYPHILESGGSLYMCPETNEANEIRLYKCHDFPLNWKLHKVLMKDVSAADTNIFEHDGRWWMLTSIDSAQIGDHGSELHLFWADAPDSDHWTPHPQNPVIFDSLRARSGGLIIDRGNIYRVFQVAGFDIYGASMGVAKIVEINSERYHEERVCSIRPQFLKGIKGTHTLNFDQGVLAFDFARYEQAGN